MAATNFTPISTYYTTTASAVPTAGNLVNGELALNINTADGKLFYKDSAGVVQVLATRDSTSGSFTNLSYTGTLTGGTGVVNLGSGQFYKDASGNIGVGTASPAVKLDIAGAAHSTSGFILGTATNGTTGQFATDNTNNYVDYLGSLIFRTAAASSEKMRITSAGDVGIGTASPVSVGGYGSLTVNGTTGSLVYLQTNASSAMQISTNASGAAITAIGASLPLYFSTNSTERMRIDSAGNVGIGTATPGYTATNRKVLALNGGNSAGEGAILAFMTGGVNRGYLYSVATDLELWCETGSVTMGNASASSPLIFKTNNTERMRIDSSGNLLVGQTSAPSVGSAKLAVQNNTGTFCSVFSNTAGNTLQFWGTGSASTGWNAADSVSYMAKQATTSRSLNAAGTLNAAGLDYAEYMVKAGVFEIAKGDVVGIDANGKLTNVFTDAISFVVKSTSPSYVGGDTWGVDLEGDELEAARQTVDRIAFSGQVPVNVIGATAGQYIVPVNDNGAIKGQAVSNPTFEQYQLAVGKVIAIEADGRAKIIVKVA